MRRVPLLVTISVVLRAPLLVSAPSFAQTQARAARTTLDIYGVDVEGGNATLFVAASGESSNTRNGSSKTYKPAAGPS